MHYNYVYFNATYLSSYVVDDDEYNAICLRDLYNYPGVKVIQCPYQHLPFALRYILAGVRRLNNKLGIRAFRSLTFPFFTKIDFSDEKPLCFVFATSDYPIVYVDYLKKRYPNSKFVKLHRDLIKIAHLHSEYSEENMNKYFDVRMSYDEGEAKQYGFYHFNEIESKIDVPISDEYPLSDVFFAGKVKDRLPKILAAYKTFTDAGLKCDFYLTGVSNSDRKELPGITYAEHFMPYKEMLYRSINSRCMLDINQEGAVGYTSRILEAIIYNKKIIVDNPVVKDMPYYKTGYILFSDMNDIDPSFVLKDVGEIDYQYKGEFSPIHLIEQIDSILTEKFIQAKS